MLKQRVAQKIGNGRGARVTAVPALVYYTLDLWKIVNPGFII